MGASTANMVRNLTLSPVVGGEVGTVRASDQPLAVNDGDGAPPMGNPSSAYKFLQRDCYAWSCGAEHDPEELVSKWDFMVVEAIICQKQPARQPFLDLVAPGG
jgi:hypothetical protein